MNYDITKEMLARSIVNVGNKYLIAKAMKKGLNSEPVTMGVIGGSITQGTAASSIEKSYAGIVKEWWENTFPKSDIKFVNAGLGATGSVIGVHRIEDDLLIYKPDFVVVEFAVNDAIDDICKETYENIIRRILSLPNKPGIILLFMTDNKGFNAQEIQQQIGCYYNLPMISYRDAVWSEILNGNWRWEDISPDHIHPNDKGHAIAAMLVINYLKKVYDELESIEVSDISLPSPLISNHFVNAKLYSSKTISADSLGSFKVTDNAFWEFKDGWKVKSGTTPIVFNVYAKNVFVLYLKTLSNAGGKAKVKINNGDIIIIDSAFPDGWGDYAEYCLVCSKDKNAYWNISISLEQDEKKDEFTILGLMIS